MPPSRLPLFTTFPSVPEKMYPSSTNPTTRSQTTVGLTTPPSGLKTPAKRTSVDVESSQDRPPSKKLKREESVAVHIPEPHEMPPVEDDGSKPPYSYAILIGMAILRATNRRLTLAQIYKWISDNFSYYRAGDFGWQNSIRHNLSLHKAFVKQERPKDDPGKGHYWVIEPGMEAQFLKDRPFRKASVMSMIPVPPPSISFDRQPKVPAKKPSVSPAEVNYMPPPARRASTSNNQDLSSDATLPASDPALQDDTSDDHDNAPFPPPLDTSPLQAIRSSPPVAPRTFHRDATPPTPSRPATSASAAPRPKTRKTAPVNDSGYYSSLESSALRPRKNGHILTSDLDIEPPRIKRGRAEEEIARIRSSSHDISPMRLRAFRDTTAQFIGSSPLRNQYLSTDAGPLTPAIKFKKPAQPPPSLSPNTNLQNHRKKIQQMVNSPIKRLGIMEEIQPWSPSFTLNDEPFAPNDNIQVPLDLFSEQFPANVSTPNYGSPEKRSASRDRFNVTSGVLADITAIGPNTRLNTPLAHSSKARAAALKFYESPCKKSDTDRYIDLSHDDLFSFNLFSEEGAGDVDGVDLLQGFEKIGQPGKDGHSPKQLFGKGSSRLGSKGSKGSKGHSRF